MTIAAMAKSNLITQTMHCAIINVDSLNLTIKILSDAGNV